MASSAESSAAGGMRKAPSLEWRWVSTEEEDDEDRAGAGAGTPAAVGAVGRGGSFESEDDEDDDEEEEEKEKGRKRLIRTVPSVDWFDVEGNEVSVAQQLDDSEEFDFGRTMFLALQTLAVVFGDIGIGPLYTFDVMFNKYPIVGEEDVLGALSLVLYTLILMPLVKYVLVVLWANDDGEGGIFALYSLICRNAKVSLIPNQVQSEKRMSSFRLKLPTPELERSIKVKEKLESSLLLKKLLLGLVLFGTSMFISNGVITPAMSVLSAVSGLKVGLPNTSQDVVVMISVALLIVLFSVQRYATSKVGFAIGPSLLLWFCCLGGIGIYNLSLYGPTAFKAFNPLYIIYYFGRNPFQAWLSLGGCLLCATGSEAIFSNLCYFPVRYVQYMFVLLVLPCLVLAYLGQAAFLIANQKSSEQVFFSSIPSGVFWPVFLVANLAALIASRTMTVAIFQCLKQSIALGCFPRLKIVHTSRKFMAKIYIPVVNWFLMVSCLGFIILFRNIYDVGNAYAIAELGVMIMATVYVTIIMLLIWEFNITKVLSFVITFLFLELIFFSSALSSVGDGGWALLIFASVLLMIMFIWNYGSKLKYDSEVKQKLSKDLMRKLGPNLGTIRAPGLGLVYSDIVKGVPAIFGHFLTSLPAIHSIIVFVCIRNVPVPVVPQSERFLFQRVCSRGYHMFRCIARYGYKDKKQEHHSVFERLLIEGLEKFLQREAVELSLQSEDDVDSDEEPPTPVKIIQAPNGSLYSLDVPLLADYAPSTELIPEASCSTPQHDPVLDYAQNLELELAFIKQSKRSGAVYLIDNPIIKARKDSWFFKKLMINYFFAFLRNNCRRAIMLMSIPHSNMMQVRMTSYV
ncbi:probable potassium transporter 15 isoform X1 [Miscanthus floridulus]|uniref:probable potassium transporter 15 isoform X1 n=1 Tax=Miscanthus floridulus TaxID=154761 RepID=UPI0034583ABA